MSGSVRGARYGRMPEAAGRCRAVNTGGTPGGAGAWLTRKVLWRTAVFFPCSPECHTSCAGLRRNTADSAGTAAAATAQVQRRVPGDVTAGSAGAPARASTQVSEVLRRVVRDGRDSCRCTSARRSASANDRRGDHERRRFRWQSPDRVRGRQCAAYCRGRRAKRGGERRAKRAQGCCGCRRTSVNIARRLSKRKRNGPRHPRCFGARRGPCSAQAAMR